MAENLVQPAPARSAQDELIIQPAIGRGQWTVLAAAFLRWMFDRLEMGIFPLVARPALQEMQNVAGALYAPIGRTRDGMNIDIVFLGAEYGGFIFSLLG